MSESYDPQERLETLVSSVRLLHHQRRFDSCGPRLRDPADPFDRLCYAAQALLSGALPDAETLLFLALSFRKYENSKGSISLDEAFGLKSRPKAGNPSAQYAKKNERNSLLFEIAYARAKDPTKTIEEVALRLCGSDSDCSGVETLMRNYTRFNWGEVEKQIREAIEKGEMA